jgi:hypothetical protein
MFQKMEGQVTWMGVEVDVKGDGTSSDAKLSCTRPTGKS